MKKLIATLLLLAMTTGCTWSHRHPKATIVGITAMGVGIGVAAGLATRLQFCPTVINGYPYKGTGPCPGPNYEPPGGKKHR